MPLPLPPRGDKTDHVATEPSAVNDRRPHDVEDKLRTLRDYRRAGGLCIKCGEKWSWDHRCAEQVQLHVLQEFWDICHAEDSGDCVSDSTEPTEAQVLVAVSLAALNGKTVINTIQFIGSVQGFQARILLDSGSSHTFLSASFAP